MPTLPRLADLEADLATCLGRALAAGGLLSASSAETAARGLLEGREVPPEVAVAFGEGPLATLISFDADRIQPWVFASERLPVVRGASGRLEDLNKRVRLQGGEIPGVSGVVYSAGGGGMLFAPVADRGQQEALVADVRKWLEPDCPEMTFTVVAEPLFARDFRSAPPGRTVTAEPQSPLRRFDVVEGVAGALTRIQIKVRQAKDEKPPPPAARLRPLPGTAAERCPSCGRRPPGKSPVTGDGPGFWCEWCRRMRGHGRAEFVGGDDEKVPTFVDLARALGESRRPYLAFLAIDGNGLGGVVQRVRSFLALRAFSEATTTIYEAARERAREVVRAVGTSPDWKGDEPILSLLSGGDEVTLVLPAAAAPRVAIEVLRAIEEGFAEATAEGGLLAEAFADDPALLSTLRSAGAGAGLVAARDHYPVRLLHRYAHHLQGRAKHLCAADSGPRSALAWALLTDSSPLPDSDAVAPDGAWSVADFQQLLTEVNRAAARRLPQSVLHGLLGELRREEQALSVLPSASNRSQVAAAVAANFFRYQLARNRALAQWWTEVAPAPEPGEDAVTTWMASQAGRRLPALVDLLALDPIALPAAEEVR